MSSSAEIPEKKQAIIIEGKAPMIYPPLPPKLRPKPDILHTHVKIIVNATEKEFKKKKSRYFKIAQMARAFVSLSLKSEAFLVEVVPKEK